MSSAVVEAPGFGSAMAAVFVSLALVCLAAYALLRWLGSLGLGRSPVGPIRVISRCPLEPRRSVYLLEVGGRYLLVGAAEGGLGLLAELDSAEVASLGVAPQPTPRRFAEVLAGLMAKRGAGRTRSERPGADAQGSDR
jgi:flagellar protein FliO/FliZ